MEPEPALEMIGPIRRDPAGDVMALREVLARLSRIARASLDDFVEGDGVSLAKARARGALCAVREVRVGASGEVSVKLHDTLAALVELAKLCGGHRERLEVRAETPLKVIVGFDALTGGLTALGRAAGLPEGAAARDATPLFGSLAPTPDGSRLEPPVGSRAPTPVGARAPTPVGAREP